MNYNFFADPVELPRPELSGEARTPGPGGSLHGEGPRRPGQPQADPPDPRHDQPRRMDPMGGRSSATLPTEVAPFPGFENFENFALKLKIYYFCFIAQRKKT